MEESNPGGHVASVHALLVSALHHEVECLGEPEEEDDVDDGEGEHVARDHGEDHCHEWSRQFDGSAVVDSVIVQVMNTMRLTPQRT